MATMKEQCAEAMQLEQAIRERICEGLVMASSFPDDWKTLPIETCMDAIIDYRGKSPRKSVFGIPLVTAKIIKGGRIEKPKEFILPEDYDAWMSRGLPKPGDVVMTTEAPLGEIAQLDDRKLALAGLAQIFRWNE
jgi:type I restriction enzyme S subunit